MPSTVEGGSFPLEGGWVGGRTKKREGKGGKDRTFSMSVQQSERHQCERETFITELGEGRQLAPFGLFQCLKTGGLPFLVSISTCQAHPTTRDGKSGIYLAMCVWEKGQEEDEQEWIRQ